MNKITQKSHSKKQATAQETFLSIGSDSELYEVCVENINDSGVINNLFIIDIESKNIIAEYSIAEVENESNGEIYNRAWDSAVAEGKVNNDERRNYIVLRIAE